MISAVLGVLWNKLCSNAPYHVLFALISAYPSPVYPYEPHLKNPQLKLYLETIIGHLVQENI